MIISALVKRNFISLSADRGRYTDMAIYPITFLVTYGLLAWSDVISKEQSIPFLLANLTWTLSASVQNQSNICMMINLWSREYRELFREGIDTRQLFIANAIFSSTMGLVNLTVFSLTIPFFCKSWEPVLRLLEIYPSLVICAIAISSFVVGFITLLGRSWGFLSWTGLQVIIMFSSPFVPLAKLPLALQCLAWLSPFTHLFEFVRNPQPELLLIAAIQGLILLWLGLGFMQRMADRVKRTKGLHSA